MKRFAVLAVVACLGGSALSGTGRADLITYTEQATASGSLGSTSFTNALVTLTFTGDTANVTQPRPGIFANSTGTATVTVAGLGTATFTDAIEVFDVQRLSAAGFADSSAGGIDVLFSFNSVFASYDLTTPIGPASGSSSTSTGQPFGTDLGPLVFSSVAGTSTFTATTSTTATPEPASLTLLGVGAVGLLGYGWRQRKRAAA
jgi:hypothetical protein